MTVSPEQIKEPDFLKNESRFANGLHTEGGIAGGKSIICNIDNIHADPTTLREIQEEYKFSPDGNIRMNKYQLEKFKIAQEKAVLKHFYIEEEFCKQILKYFPSKTLQCILEHLYHIL